MSDQDDFTFGEVRRILVKLDSTQDEMRKESRDDRDRQRAMEVDHAVMRERLVVVERDMKGLRADLATRSRHDMFSSFSPRRAGVMVGFLFSLFEFGHLALERLIAVMKGH